MKQSCERLLKELKAAIAAATPEEQKKLADALKALEGKGWGGVSKPLWGAALGTGHRLQAVLLPRAQAPSTALLEPRVFSMAGLRAASFPLQAKALKVVAKDYKAAWSFDN